MRSIQRTKECDASEHTERSAEDAQHTERMHLRQSDRVKQFGRQDEHRVARRVRLMERHVVVANAEREIDGIEIFERRREEREVKREENAGEECAR
jgi:hypothetical protein